MEDKVWLITTAVCMMFFFFGHMRVIPQNFKTFMSSIVVEFDELCGLVVLIIASHVRSTGEVDDFLGCSMKLCMQQRFLNFLLYMKYDNITSYDAFQWNWSRSTLNDDALFIPSCIDHALANDMVWTDVAERDCLSTLKAHFSRYIDIVDGILVKIWKPWNNQE